MKIILIGPAYPYRGGIAHFTGLLYKHLTKSHDVEVVTFSRQYPKFLFPGQTQLEATGENLIIPSMQLVDSLNPLTWIRTGRSIARSNPDLVIFMYWLPFFALAYAAIAARIKRGSRANVLFLCHNIIPHENRIGDRFLTKRAFRYGDAFVVQSREVKKDLLSILPAAVHRVLPHPIYEIFGNAIPKKEARERLGFNHQKIILFFGFIRAYKGLDTILRAMPAIRKKVDVHLLVVGESYEDLGLYQRLVGSGGLESSVTFVRQYVPANEVKLFFSAADCVVLPYKSATQSGIVQIAYQFTKPVIATDVGGLSEIVLEGRTGFVVPPDDPDALGRAVIRFYEENREEDFVRNVGQEKEQYGWNHFVQGIEELVRSLNTRQR